MGRLRLGDLLLEAGLINEDQLEGALREQAKWGGRLGETIVEMHILSEERVMPFVSRQLGTALVDVAARSISSDVSDLLAEDYIKQHQVLPFAQQGKFLDVAMRDPLNGSVIDEIRMLTRLNVRPYLCGAKSLQTAIDRLYNSEERVYSIGVPPEPDSIDEDVDIHVDFDVEGSTPESPAQPPAHAAAAAIAALSIAPVPVALSSAPSLPHPGAPPPFHPPSAPAPSVTAGATATPAATSTGPFSGTKTPPVQPADAMLTLSGDDVSMTASGTQAAPLTDMIDLFAADMRVSSPQTSADAKTLSDVDALQARVANLETLLQRDEMILRRLLNFLVEKKTASRDEILKYILGQTKT